MASPVQQMIADLIEQSPSASNEQIAAEVRRRMPGATTSAASVSSTKSRLKQESQFTRSGDFGPTVDPFSGYEPLEVPQEEERETLVDAKARIAVRYSALERMSKRIVAGKVPSLIVSGPPGLGKSFTVTAALEDRWPLGPNPADYGDERADAYDGDEDFAGKRNRGEVLFDVVSGSVSAVGLYQALWYTRNGGVLVLDDCDDVFRDETSLNLLKAALDSKPKRTLSWRKEAKWLDDYGIDDRFTFTGHVVFLTNIDFEEEIKRGGKMAEHFKALIDRSMYLCLTLRTRRDFLIRIRQVAEGKDGMLVQNFGLTLEQSEEVLDFVADNQHQFYNLSLRLVGQIATCYSADYEGWKDDVTATKMRTI